MQYTDLGSSRSRIRFSRGGNDPVKMDINQKKRLNMYRNQKVMRACFGWARVSVQASWKKMESSV
jgi:hypothetical protein